MSSIEERMVSELLDWKLQIPEYQRPYKWNTKNINELLNDITKAIEQGKKHTGFKYRIGTIILYENDKEISIVDGQQRIISLALIKYCLEKRLGKSCSNAKDNFINTNSFSDRISQENIRTNYTFINEWVSLISSNEIKELLESFRKILQVIVIKVKEIEEAFQLFDSQNNRGKALEPHDLLKAYHLREMRSDRYEMEYVVKKWEANDTRKVKELFDLYLFPVLNWTYGKKSYNFTTKDIDVYKGINEYSNYSYAKRAINAMPYFQMTEEFISGKNFFEMVEHYLFLLEIIEKEIKENMSFVEIKNILYGLKDGINHHSTGFIYAKNLFFCSLLRYYDKFHNFDEMAVKKLFVWAFMLRVDVERLGFSSVNKYAIGETEGNYTNKIAMFAKIRDARLHTEISGLIVSVTSKKENAISKSWNGLYICLREIMGKKE